MLNDSYRTDLCLLYPPHLIAIASIYLSFSLHLLPNILSVGGKPQASSSQSSTSAGATVPEGGPIAEPSAKRLRTQSFSGQQSSPAAGMGAGMNSSQSAAQPASMPGSPLPSHQAAATHKASIAATSTPRGKTDPITFLASLNVQLPIVLEIAQEIISLYACWKTYEELASTEPGSNAGGGVGNAGGAGGGGDQAAMSASARMSATISNALASYPGMAGRSIPGAQAGAADERVIRILARMRAAREMDLAHPANAGRP